MNATVTVNGYAMEVRGTHACFLCLESTGIYFTAYRRAISAYPGDNVFCAQCADVVSAEIYRARSERVPTSADAAQTLKLPEPAMVLCCACGNETANPANVAVVKCPECLTERKRSFYTVARAKALPLIPRRRAAQGITSVFNETGAAFPRRCGMTSTSHPDGDWRVLVLNRGIAHAWHIYRGCAA